MASNFARPFTFLGWSLHTRALTRHACHDRYAYAHFAPLGVSAEEYTALFAPLTMLHGACSDFCADLGAAVDENGRVGELGELFLLHIPSLADPLTTITLNKAKISATMTAWKESSTDIARRIQLATAACGGLDFDSYILKPFQRLSRYPMLINEVLKRTPEGHSDHEGLAQAHRVSTALLADCNEAMRSSELRAHVSDIADALIVPKQLNPDGREAGGASLSAHTLLLGEGIDVVGIHSFDQVRCYLCHLEPSSCR